MRQLPYQHGEFPRAAAESFGRIARQQPAPAAGNTANVVPAADDYAVAASDALARNELPFAQRTALQLEGDARRDRAVRIGALVAAALSALRAAARELSERIRRAREAHATLRALRALDSRTLHDLGISRSELLSVAFDLGRDTENARVRFVRADSTLRIL